MSVAETIEPLPPMPFRFDCPRCGAKASEPCRAISGNPIWPTATHIARWRLAGIEKPTREQINENARQASKLRKGAKHRIIKGGRII